MSKRLYGDKFGETVLIELSETLDYNYNIGYTKEDMINAEKERNRVEIFANNLKDIESIRRIIIEIAWLEWFEEGEFYLPSYTAVGGKIVDEEENSYTTSPKSLKRLTSIDLTDEYTFDDISKILEELEIYFNKDEIYDMINVIEAGKCYVKAYN